MLKVKGLDYNYNYELHNDEVYIYDEGDLLGIISNFIVSEKCTWCLGKKIGTFVVEKYGYLVTDFNDNSYKCRDIEIVKTEGRVVKRIERLPVPCYDFYTMKVIL